jgi:hypothetical protein
MMTKDAFIFWCYSHRLSQWWQTRGKSILLTYASSYLIAMDHLQYRCLDLLAPETSWQQLWYCLYQLGHCMMHQGHKILQIVLQTRLLCHPTTTYVSPDRPNFPISSQALDHMPIACYTLPHTSAYQPCLQYPDQIQICFVFMLARI